MRLATFRGLARPWRLASSPWRASANGRYQLLSRQHRRSNSSTAAATSPPTANAEQPSNGANAKPHEPAATGKLDAWSNTPPSILDHLNRHLYLQPNHPLAITRALIESQFPAPEYGNYTEPDPIVSVRDNFDVLGFPRDHPGRSKTDTYYINGDTVLRTHTSAHQMAYFQRMARNEASPAQTKRAEEGYTVLADVYRRDAVDRSHYPVFHQMEGARLWRRLGSSEETAAKVAADAAETAALVNSTGVAVVEGGDAPFDREKNPLQSKFHSAAEAEAIVAHLKRTLEKLVVKIFTVARQSSGEAQDATAASEPIRIRWVETYFPFTSPSFELEVYWQGDWLEVVGCGVVRQELLNAAAVPDRIGWALGLGIERIAMLLFGIPDIRLFWSQDPRFLSQFEAGKVTRFVPFSKYPLCYKDVAFWLPDSTSQQQQQQQQQQQEYPPFHENDIMEIIREVAGERVEDVQMIDDFTHPKTKRRSLCYRVNYRSLERTLTNEEVNAMHDTVRERLVQKTGVQLR